MALSFSVLSSTTVSPLLSSRGQSAAAASRRPAEALSRDAEGTRVRLSAFGRAQAAAAAVQSAAQRLQDAQSGTPATAADARKLAETFVKAANDERAALQQAGGDAAAAEAGRARIAVGQLDRQTADNQTAFRDSGIRVAADGSLAVDAKALEGAFNTNPAALMRALGDVGRAAEATASRQLSQSGSIGAAVDNLGQRLQRLENRQAELAEARGRIESSQLAVEASSRRYGFGAVGAGAYLGIFGI